MKKNCNLINRLLGVFVLFIIVASIAACGGSGGKSVFTKTETDTTTTLELIHDKDTITKINVNSVTDAKSASEEEQKVATEMAEAAYKAIDGIEVKVDFKDGKMIIDLAIDVEKVKKSSPDMISGMMGVSADKIGSFEEVKKALLEEGFTEKK